MNFKVNEMTKIALFSALMVVGAYISIPTPYIPFTLQVLFCVLSGIVLGSKKGAASQIVYVLLGLIGLPVFSGGAGGFGIIFKPSFGYLIGFIACSYIIGKIIEGYKKVNFLNVLLSSIFGVLVIYILGVSYLYIILNLYIHKPIGIYSAIQKGALIFIPFDILKCVLASYIGLKIRNYYRG